MKAMIWKELRENLRWAVLAALAVGFANIYSLSQAFGQPEGFNPYSHYDGAAGLPMPTAITAPLVAILFGFLQIVPELRRDQWAFLMHRPVPRATLFWGKLVAGVLLYVLATATPFLAAMLWVATPGRMAAPFTWHLALPGVTDILAGFLFYLAGMLTALRPARWYGSRALGIAAAGICYVVTLTSCNEFWSALLLIAACTVIGLIATRGSFLTTGEYQGQPRLARAALGTTLFSGVTVVCCAAIGLLFTMGSSLVAPPEKPYEWTRYEVNEAGKVYRVTYDTNSIKSMVDLDGKSLPIPRRQDGERLAVAALDEQPIVNWFGPLRTPGYRDTSRYFQFLDAHFAQGRRTRWFYDNDRAIVVGYWDDANKGEMNRQLRGYLAPNGFFAADDTLRLNGMQKFPGRQFALGGPGSDNDLLVFPNAVYRVEFDPSPRAILITTTNSGNPIRGAIASRRLYNPDRSVAPTVLLVATDRQVQAFTRDGRLLFSLPQGQDTKLYPGLSVSISRDRSRFYLWSSPPGGGGRPQRHPTLLTSVALDVAGKMTVERKTLPPLPQEVNSPEWEGSLFALGVPPAGLAGYTLYATAGSALRLPGARDMSTEIRKEPQRFALFVLLCIGAGLLSAIFAWLIGRRCAFPAKVRWQWSIGVFLLGPFGLLMLLSMQPWPAREACAHCSRRRVVSNELCEHCGAPFPAAPRDGTEIFESVASVNTDQTLQPLVGAHS